MSNSTVQTALFFDVFLYFFDVSEHLALISLNMVICPVYDFGWPVLGGVADNPLIKGDDRGWCREKNTGIHRYLYGSKCPTKIVIYKSEGLNKHGGFRIY